jgi:hypothetical protein
VIARLLRAVAALATRIADRVDPPPAGAAGGMELYHVESVIDMRRIEKLELTLAALQLDPRMHWMDRNTIALIRGLLGNYAALVKRVREGARA